ncbi:MAG: hypothetical protein OSB82_03550 [Alphaproteobacteria bacterium]|nr:hypothetical protein [Alphaproteobacteria bacterium]
MSVPYLDQAVSPAAAAVIRAVRMYEPRMVREVFGQAVAHDNRYARAAVMAVARYNGPPTRASSWRTTIWPALTWMAGASTVISAAP